MKRPDWSRVQEVFLSAVDLPPEELEAFLDSSCEGDPALRAEVKSLIESDRESDPVKISSAIHDEAFLVVQSVLPGDRVGAYRIEGELGRGGMGAVYVAVRDDDEFHKRVALKVVKRGMDTDEVLRRFRYERQIVANLEHPYIAHIIDGGTTKEGQPFLVLEKVDGVRIDDYCRENKLDVNSRLRLFLRICEAVSYAHRSLVVHRDLKPSNILVTKEGIPKLLDFGVAKVLDPATDGDATTHFSHRPLTPEYASPEQVRGGLITTATDVYSLGTVLYELLTEARAQKIETHTPTEIYRIVCEVQPPQPSAIANGLNTDLDNIVMMAMRKEPERRYHSVDQLSADIVRYLEGRPVAARKDSRRYRAAKFVARNRLAVTATVLFIGSLSIATAVAVKQAHRAQRRFEDVRRLADSFIFDFEGAIHDVPGATKARHMVVKTGLQYLESVAQEAGSDPKLLRELASAYDKIGQVQGTPGRPNIGDTAGARTSLLRAQTLREKLAAASPDDLGLRRDYIRTWIDLSNVQRVQQDTAGARRSVQKGLAALAELRARENSPGETRLLDADLHRALVDVDAQTGDLRASLAAGQYAMTLYEQALAREPQDLAVQQKLLAVLCSVGGSLMRMGEVAKSADSFKRAVDLWTKYFASMPNDPGAQRLALRMYEGYGDVLGYPGVPNLGRAEMARDSYEKALAIAERAVNSDANNYTAIQDMVSIQSRMCRLLRGRDKTAALYRARQAHELASRLGVLDPSNRLALLGEAITRSQLAETLMDGGRSSQALVESEIAAKTCLKLLDASPAESTIAVAAASSFSQLTDWTLGAGRIDAAEKYNKDCISICERHLSTQGNDAKILHALSIAYRTEAEIAEKRRRWSDVIAWSTKATETLLRTTGYSDTQTHLAFVHELQARAQAALAKARKGA